MMAIWPAALTAGVAFAIPQFLVSNFHGPWLVDIVASICSMAAVVGLLKVWKPRDADGPKAGLHTQGVPPPRGNTSLVRQAWIPWILLSVLVFLWGIPAFKRAVDKVS